MNESIIGTIILMAIIGYGWGMLWLGQILSNRDSNNIIQLLNDDLIHAQTAISKYQLVEYADTTINPNDLPQPIDWTKKTPKEVEVQMIVDDFNAKIDEIVRKFEGQI